MVYRPRTNYPQPPMSPKIKGLSKMVLPQKMGNHRSLSQGVDYPLLITPLFTRERYLSKIANYICVF